MSADGGTGAFHRPEPLDPNDRVRQRTQARDDSYPYDRPVSYGAPRGRGSDGDERELSPDGTPPGSRASLLGRPMTAWDRLSDSIDRADGVMGDGVDAFELELDHLRGEFLRSYEDARPATDSMGPGSLFTLLSRLDPDFAAETFAPEDEEEMRGIYDLWASRMGGLEDAE